MKTKKQKDIKKLAKNHQHKRKCVGSLKSENKKQKKLNENYQHHGVTRSSGIGAAEIIDKTVN